MSKPNKTNDPLATRRLGNRPKPEAVRDAKPVGVVSLGNARKQNEMDGKTGVGNLAQVPAGRKTPTTTSSGN
jgi:hypothetical protein